MFSISLHHAEHVRRYAVHATPSGWEVICEQDSQLTTRHYEDWHRVERTVAVFKWEVSELTASGWQIEREEQQPSS
jgi:hypothetical protein